MKTRSNDIVEATAPGLSTNAQNVQRIERLFSEEQFEYLFPMRNSVYTYNGLLQSAAKFPILCKDFDDNRDADFICTKTLATMFAHFNQETGAHYPENPEGIPEWRQALYFVREVGWTETSEGGYNWDCQSETWAPHFPCGKLSNGQFKSYFGRGAKQLSYPYNYGPFSTYMYGDVTYLLNNPDLVADTWLNLASAVFFYIFPQPPKPSM
ncbi:MAG: chitinase [Aeromonas sp.]